MHWLATRRMTLRSIILPGSIAALLSEPRISERADSIAATGGEPINHPVVRHRPAMTGMPGTFELIIGRDRTAAIISAGADAMDVRVVECSDAEAAELEIIENLHRRNDDRDELLRRLVELRAERLAPEPSEAKVAGRPKTPRGAAREQVAAELHVTPEAVRAAERRAEAANDPTKNETAAPAATAEHAPVAGASLETWDLPVSAEEVASVRQVNVALEQVAKFLASAKRRLSDIAGHAEGRALFARLGSTVAEAAGAVATAQLAAVCPWCARIARLQPTCGGCAGVGYVSADAIEGVDQQLTARGAAKVVLDGTRIVPYTRASKPAVGMGSGLRATEATGRRAPKPRTLRVEMPDGSLYTPPADDVPPPGDEDGEELAF